MSESEAAKGGDQGTGGWRRFLELLVLPLKSIRERWRERREAEAYLNHCRDGKPACD